MRYRIFALAVLFALLFSHSVLAEQEADILSDSGILCLVNREKHLPQGLRAERSGQAQGGYPQIQPAGAHLYA